MDLIYLIESPAPKDLFVGRCEGRALSEALRLAETDVSYKLAADRETFLQCLEFVVRDFYEKFGGRASGLYMHVSAHGDSGGIQLTDGDYLEWDDFRHWLERVNEFIGEAQPGSDRSSKTSRLTLCFSSCDGYNAHKIHSASPCPFQYLVGPIAPVTWSDALTAFQVFYHATTVRRMNLPQAVELMNVAAGLDGVFQSYEAGNTGAPTR